MAQYAEDVAENSRAVEDSGTTGKRSDNIGSDLVCGGGKRASLATSSHLRANESWTDGHYLDPTSIEAITKAKREVIHPGLRGSIEVIRTPYPDCCH